MTCLALRWTLPVTLLVALPAMAEPASRLAAAVDARSTVQLQGSVHPRAQARYDQGRLDGATPIHGSLHLALSAAQEADLDELLREQQDPVSPNYHAWLTPAQYGARFGLSAADLARVKAWLQGQGLTVESVESGGNHIDFSGSASRVESAFQTELHRYSVDGESHFANASNLSVPAALSGMVMGVRGLDDFRPKPHLRRQAPAFTSSISGNNYLSPGDVATIYDIAPLYSAGITGSGRKIAVAGQTEVNLRDIRAFRTAAGLPVNDPQLVQVPNSGTATLQNGSSDENESDIDLEWTGGVARDATIVFVFTGSSKDVFDAMGYAITADLAPVISMSYGNCEANNASVIPTGESWLKQANAQGQTVVASSGDAGAADCDDAGAANAKGGLAVDYPASSPEVSGVGGTTFQEGGNTSAYWQAQGSSDEISSARSYIPEVAWNNTGHVVGGTTEGLSASGGGISTKFSKPSWQNTGSFTGTMRYVPDVALAADPDHDGYLFCTSNTDGTGTCTSGFRDSSTQDLTVAGGTSFSSPVFAGILTLIGQKAGLKGLGNANPVLYQLAASSGSLFHDITSGNNIVPTSSGQNIGYSSAAGYDPVTGLGSPVVAAVAAAWPASSSSSSSSSSSGSSGSSSSSSSGGGSSSSSSSGGSSSSSSSSSSGGSTSGGGGGGGGGAWSPWSLLLLGALRLLGRRR